MNQSHVVQDSMLMTRDDLMAQREQAITVRNLRDRILNFYRDPESYRASYGPEGVFALKEEADRVGMEFNPQSAPGEAGRAFVNELFFGIPGAFDQRFADATRYAVGAAKTAKIAADVASLMPVGFGARLAMTGIKGSRALLLAAGGAREAVPGVKAALSAYRTAGKLPSAKVAREIGQFLPAEREGLNVVQLFRSLGQKAGIGAKGVANEVKSSGRTMALLKGEKNNVAYREAVMSRLNALSQPSRFEQGVALAAGAGLADASRGMLESTRDRPGATGLDRLLYSAGRGVSRGIETAGTTAAASLLSGVPLGVRGAVGAGIAAHGTITQDPVEAMFGAALMIPGAKFKSKGVKAPTVRVKRPAGTVKPASGPKLLGHTLRIHDAPGRLFEKYGTQLPPDRGSRIVMTKMIEAMDRSADDFVGFMNKLKSASKGGYVTIRSNGETHRVNIGRLENAVRRLVINMNRQPESASSMFRGMANPNSPIGTASIEDFMNLMVSQMK